ncbi:MAG: ABC transporter permease [bacterium]
MAFHFNLIYQLSKRDLQLRYRGTWLGVIWLVLQPLLLVLIYTFVFSEVLNSRFEVSLAHNVENNLSSNLMDSPVPFPFYIIAGLLVFNHLSDAVIRASSTFINHHYFLKHTSLPAGLLPIIPVLSSMLLEIFFAVIFILALFVLQQITFSHLLWLCLVYPLLLSLRLLLTISLSLWVSVLTVFVRDLVTALPMLFILLLLISPIFYPISAVPESMQWFYIINPMSHLLILYREAFLLAQFDLRHWSYMLMGLVMFFTLSLYSFRKLLPKINYIL